ncbi:MAG: flagellar biosynthesis repressor FlbT [Rhodospirillales bacterium]|nr:MAG: flagellar biosynthesis repressor FlbT [Rhodospirillales bacterium]
MALVIDLKAGERVIIGEAVVTNGPQRATLNIEGDVPILREKDILRPEEATTPCKRLYLAVQIMYVTGKATPLHEAYFQLAREIQFAAPSTIEMILEINQNIIAGSYYRALKAAKRLVQYEAELTGHV